MLARWMIEATRSSVEVAARKQAAGCLGGGGAVAEAGLDVGELEERDAVVGAES
jgi:hypothetical protein